MPCPLCRRIELCARYDIDRNVMRAGKIAQLPHAAAMQSVRDEDTVDAAPRLDRLGDRMTPREDSRRRIDRMLLNVPVFLFHARAPLSVPICIRSRTALMHAGYMFRAMVPLQR